MRVAAIQFCPAFKDQEANIRVAASLAIQAAQGGARLIVLPELCTTGMSFMSRAEAEPFAEQISDYGRAGAARSMEVFGAVAKKYGVSVAWGVMERDYGTGLLYNSQVLMQPDSHFVTYRKINRWGNDWIWAAEGQSNPPVVEVEGRKVGLLICRDIRDKYDATWKDFYEPGDAEIIAFSSNWGDGAFPATIWMDFVKDKRTHLVVANRYGRELNNDFGEGGSGIIYPDQTVYCEGLQWSKDCIVIGEV